jgi:hypothetical protein
MNLWEPSTIYSWLSSCQASVPHLPYNLWLKLMTSIHQFEVSVPPVVHQIILGMPYNLLHLLNDMTLRKVWFMSFAWFCRMWICPNMIGILKMDWHWPSENNVSHVWLAVLEAHPIKFQVWLKSRCDSQLLAPNSGWFPNLKVANAFWSFCGICEPNDGDISMKRCFNPTSSVDRILMTSSLLLVDPQFW